MQRSERSHKLLHTTKGLQKSRKVPTDVMWSADILENRERPQSADSGEIRKRKNGAEKTIKQKGLQFDKTQQHMSGTSCSAGRQWTR